jgi:hypothetical protein
VCSFHDNLSPQPFENCLASDAPTGSRAFAFNPFQAYPLGTNARKEIHAISSESKIVSQNRYGNTVAPALLESGTGNSRVIRFI